MFISTKLVKNVLIVGGLVSLTGLLFLRVLDSLIIDADWEIDWDYIK